MFTLEKEFYELLQANCLVTFATLGRLESCAPEEQVYFQEAECGSYFSLLGDHVVVKVVLRWARVPVLVIHGKDDALVPAAEAEAAFATLTSTAEGASLAELHLLESTGHFALQERQAEVTRAIHTWWRKNKQRES